jgi:hypothetical protein
MGPEGTDDRFQEEIEDGYYSRNGKRVKRNDRRWYDGLQESPDRD